MALYILAIFVHSIKQKWDQGTLGTQRLTLIASRTRLGPSMDPPWPYNTTDMANVRCIVGPWQGPLKDQGWSYTQ